MAKKKKTNEDLPNENQETNDASDNFGLPDIEYKPLDRVDEVVVVTEVRETTVEPEPQPFYKEEAPMENDEPQVVVFEEEEKSNSNVIIGIVIVLVLALGGYLVYKFVYEPRQLAKQEQLAKDAAAKKAADAEAARLAEQQEAERKRLEAEAVAKPVAPAIGTIETLSGRTGRYYVVISSAIDDDLIMDRAKAVSPKGVSTKIIPPFGKWKYFRLTIGDYDTYALAQTSADAAKAEYGGGVWVIKY